MNENALRKYLEERKELLNYCYNDEDSNLVKMMLQARLDEIDIIVKAIEKGRF